MRTVNTQPAKDGGNIYIGLLRMPEVLDLTGLRKTKLYDLIHAGLAPAPLKYPAVSGVIKRNSTSYWLKSEWMEWLADRAEARDAELRKLAKSGLHGVWYPGRPMPEEPHEGFGGRA